MSVAEHTSHLSSRGREIPSLQLAWATYSPYFKNNNQKEKTKIILKMLVTQTNECDTM